MLVDQRRLEILQLTERQGFVTLQELVNHLGASESTVRRDLEYLDGIGELRRTRGGAAYTGDSITSFDDRRHAAHGQKEKIARAVAALIEPGETVLLDGGTTTLEVARCLVGKPLQVVTNSLPIANLLVNQPNIELIFLGGYLYPRTGVALGPLAVAALKQMRVPKLVMSVGGITDKGFFNSNSLLVDTERLMIEAAEQVVVATDSSKFGRTALVHLCPFSAAQTIVTDEGIPEEWRQRLEAASLTVHLAK